MVDGALRAARCDGVVEVVFNRPERHNAFTAKMYEALIGLCAELRQAPEVRAVVFRGEGGRAFAAGNEISEFVDVTDGAGGIAYEAGVLRVLRAIQELPQVTVAAIEGICVGGGLAVATHCDIRVCSDGSRFGYPIARTVGNALSAEVVYRCVAIFGESLTREMLLLSRLVDAHRAHAVGAVAAVLPEGGLDGELKMIVDGLRSTAQGTLTATKDQLLRHAELLEVAPDDDLARMAQVYGSSDFREGVRAFLAKEQPNFGDIDRTP